MVVELMICRLRLVEMMAAAGLPVAGEFSAKV
jgi:hypothetical protein